MKRTLLSLILISFFASSISFGQSRRNIPYPILFVHGWNGSDESWYAMITQLKDQSLNVDIDYTNKRAGIGSRLDYLLNADGDNSTSVLNRNGVYPNFGDVVDLQSFINPVNDVFVINFNSGIYGNQSAAMKQGFAVGLAIQKILQKTGSEKVILFGHSMGGLAIREYLQNSENWLTKDGAHHVAKFISTGTPHAGTNKGVLNLASIAGYNERSEAVRDLRAPDYAADTKGVYLYGGLESANYAPNILLPYLNYDVNCNGSKNDYVKGLNQKNIPSNLSFTGIYGTGSNAILGVPGLDDDGIVLASSATLSNLYNINVEMFEAKNSEIEARSKDFTQNDLFLHTKLPKLSFINIYALDEPEEKELAYNILPDQTYKGFLTPHPKSQDFDYDKFKINLPQRGILTLDLKGSTGIDYQLLDNSGYQVYFDRYSSNQTAKISDPGNYYLGIFGETGASTGSLWHFNTYTFSNYFCPLPNLPIIISSNGTSLCEGQSTVLGLSSLGYDTYTWYRDGVKIGDGNSVIASESGEYSVEGKKCGISEKSSNTIKLNFKPLPVKPIVIFANDGLTSSYATGNQWYHNGSTLPGETNQNLTGIESGGYSVKFTEKGCSSMSDVITITGESTNIERETLIYPNPVKTTFEIKTPLQGKLIYTISDLNGRVIQNTTKGANHSTLTVKAPAGMYFIRVENGSTTVVKKIIVE